MLYIYNVKESTLCRFFYGLIIFMSSIIEIIVEGVLSSTVPSTTFKGVFSNWLIISVVLEQGL